MISLRPGSKLRPSTIFTSSRTWNAAGCTPRSGTLASVPVERLGRSMTTKSSAEASGPAADAQHSRRVGDDARHVAGEAARHLAVAAAAQHDRGVRRARRSQQAWRNPSPIESTATSTPTTPATPTTVAADAPRRWPIVRRLSQVTTPDLREPAEHVETPPQRRSASAMRSRIACMAGRKPVTIPSRTARTTPSDGIPPGQIEDRKLAPRRIARRDGQPGEPETEQAADDRDQARLGQHEPEHLPVGEAHRLEHAELVRPLAHGLGHGVARDQQDGEEDRAAGWPVRIAPMSPTCLANDCAKRLLGLGLGLGRRVGEDRRRSAARFRPRARVVDPDHVPADRSLGCRCAPPRRGSRSGRRSDVVSTPLSLPS